MNDSAFSKTPKNAADRSNLKSPIVLEVFSKRAAAMAGIKSGDRIISVDGEPIKCSEEFIRLIHVRKNCVTKIELNRDSNPATVSLTPDKQGRIGVRVSDLNDAVVKTLSAKGAPIFSSASLLVASGAFASGRSGDPKQPRGTELKANTLVQVMYEEPIKSEKSDESEVVPMCKLQLNKDATTSNGTRIVRGDWFTYSRFLKPNLAAAEHIKGIVTFKQVQLLKADMMLSDVNKLVGSAGHTVSHSKFRGIESQTWLWQNADGSYLCCNFENGQLTYKSAFLLQ